MKAWRARFTDHVATWTSKLPKYRAWWPKYVYHFTSVLNAVSILRHGQLHSREQATRLAMMVSDNASAAVIASTTTAHQRYARLYFRPRTPTQFHNEGIRPRDKRTSLNAHCAMPVFFFFDLASVLSEDDTCFSDGNVASTRARISSDEAGFDAIPFDDVYSDGGMGNRKGELTFARHAEILVPASLPLQPHLRMVCCRSAAERQTLLQLLGASDRTRWESQVRVATDPIFERRATYVESVSAMGESVNFHFNPASQFKGPFRLDFRFLSADRRRWAFRSEAWNQDEGLALRLGGVAGANGVAELHLDEDLAFSGVITFDPLPY